MNVFQHYGRPLMNFTALMAMLLIISGCSGITPDGNLRNNREEGPEKGLFSGSAGEFIILAPATTGSEKKVDDAGGLTHSTE